MDNNPGPNLRAYLGMKYRQNQIVNGTGFMGVQGAMFGIGYNLGSLIEYICNCNIQPNPLTKDFTPIEQTLTELDNAGINLYGN